MNTLQKKRFVMESKVCAAIVLLPAILFTACSFDKRSPEANATNQRGAAKDTTSGSNTTTDASTNDKPRYLEAKWYVDSNSDGVPDFIETELGKNPSEKDHFPVDVSDCGGAGRGEDLNVAVNTLLMLDASGSMNAKINGETKLDSAKKSLLNYAAHAPQTVKMGFLVYGHKGNNTPAGKAESCSANGVELLNPIGDVQADTFQATLDRFQPTGWTPIAAALTKAGESFNGMEGKKNHIIMVSDGLETCGGDPVALARQLHEQSFRVVVDIVGFGAGSKDVAQLKKIAEAGGGDYYDAKTRADLDDYFKRQTEAVGKTLRNANCFMSATNHANLGDNTYVNEAIAKVNAAINEAEQSHDQNRLRELWDVAPRINAACEARKTFRQQFFDRGKQLDDKAHEINQQSIDSYEKMR